jgi:DNA-binding XRE family transcriptional regulator
MSKTKRPKKVPAVMRRRVPTPAAAAAAAADARSTFISFAPPGAFPSRRAAGPLRYENIRSARKVCETYAVAPRESLWVAWDIAQFSALTEVRPLPSRDQRLLCMTTMDSASQQVFGTYFPHLLAASDARVLLASPELETVVTSSVRADRFIAVAFDRGSKAIVLHRGNLDRVVVPLAWFANAASDAAADPLALDIIDCGQTVKLGSFEAATDAILYEFDDEYRRAVKQRTIAQDDSIGGSIRRLRLQKGLTRDEFPGVTAKSIARIERGDVLQPHSRTVERIARALAVSVRDLGSF